MAVPKFVPSPTPGLSHRDRKPAPRRGARPVRLHRIEATAWFTLALAILAFGPDLSPGAPQARSRLKPALTPQAEVKTVEAEEPGRGRDARRPSEIPARGWGDIAVRTWSEFNKDRIPAVAGGVTFFSLLAVFPALAAFVSLYGLFSNVAAARGQLDLLAGLLPPDVLAFVGDQMIRLASRQGGGLGLAFAISLVFSLWSANAGAKALMDGLNIAYEERERRGLIRLNLISLAFTIGGLAFIIAVLGVVVALPVALSLVRYGGPNPMLALRWPLMLGIVVAVLEVLYRYGPSRRPARWCWVSWGGAAAAMLWLITSMAFSWYVANFAHYDRTYGSLGAVVGFMTWLWI